MINSSDFSASTTMASFDIAAGVHVESQVPNTSSDSPRQSVSLSSEPHSDRTYDGEPSSLLSNFKHETAPDYLDGKENRILVLPDMFSSIMAVDPVMNPNYFKVKSKGDAWLQLYFKPLFTHDHPQIE